METKLGPSFSTELYVKRSNGTVFETQAQSTKSTVGNSPSPSCHEGEKKC